MKFSISSNKLAQKTKVVSEVIPSKPITQILDHMLFEVKNNRLYMTATDLQTTLSVDVEVDNAEDGLIAIPAKIFNNTLSTFPDQPLTFELSEATEEDTQDEEEEDAFDEGFQAFSSFKLTITSTQGTYEITCKDAQDYPDVSSVQEEWNTDVSTKYLSHGIAKTLYAVINDDMRTNMMGVHVALSEDKINFVATDTFILAHYCVSDIQHGLEKAMTVPKKPMQILKNLIPATEEDMCKISAGDGKVKFSVEGVTLTSSLIMDKFPNYKEIMPSIDEPDNLVIELKSFVNTIQRMSNFSSSITNSLNFELKGSDTISVSAEDKDHSNKAQENVPCNYTGDEVKIKFSYKNMLQVFQNMKCEEISMYVQTSDSPSTISPVGVLDDNESETVLIMALKS